MRFNKIIFPLLAAGLLLGACSSMPGAADAASLSSDFLTSGEQAEAAALPMMMIIAPQTVSCGEDGSQECLQVKFDPEDEWQVLDTDIEGFEYVPGYRYTLMVEELAIQDAPAEGANAQFMLVQVQDQVEEVLAAAQNFENVTWVLTGMGDVSAPQGVLEKVKVTLHYDPAEARLAGTAGCNRYFGEIEINADKLVFTVGPMGMGRMACGEQVMAQENEYIQILGRVERFAMDGNLLYLFTNSEEVLIFEPEVDAAP